MLSSGQWSNVFIAILPPPLSLSPHTSDINSAILRFFELSHFFCLYFLNITAQCVVRIPEPSTSTLNLYCSWKQSSLQIVAHPGLLQPPLHNASLVREGHSKTQTGCQAKASGSTCSIFGVNAYVLSCFAKGLFRAACIATDASLAVRTVN